jgi:hypothetical protein
MVTASFIILTFNLLLDNYDENGELISHSQLYLLFEGWHLVLIYWMQLTIIHFTIIVITKIGIKYPKKRVWLPLYLMHQSLLLGLAMWVS